NVSVGRAAFHYAKPALRWAKWLVGLIKGNRPFCDLCDHRTMLQILFAFEHLGQHARRPPFFHFCWTTNIINSAKSTSIVLTCARTSASIAVRSPIISILSLMPSLPVVVSSAMV